MAYSNAEKAARKARFLAELARGAKVSQAADVVGIHRRTIYDWRDNDAEFRRAWEEVQEDFKDNLLAKYETELQERALVREDPKSHILLIFLLKKLDPAYRDSYRNESTVRHEHVNTLEINQEDLEKGISILQERIEASSGPTAPA